MLLCSEMTKFICSYEKVCLMWLNVFFIYILGGAKQVAVSVFLSSASQNKGLSLPTKPLEGSMALLFDEPTSPGPVELSVLHNFALFLLTRANLELFIS